MPLIFLLALILPVEKLEHYLLLTQVYVNGQGPFRMIVDTGAASSTLRPAIADRVGAVPRYRVEQVTVAGSALRPAGAVSLRVGDTADEVEMVFSPVAHPAADGVLGQNWLRRHAYLLDFRNGRFELDPAPPAAGLRVPLDDTDGRPSLTATVDGEPHRLVFDSGAPALLVHRSVPRHRQPARLATHNGVIEAHLGRSRLELGPTLRRTVRTVELAGPPSPGLLPASAFHAVYIAPNATHLILP